MKYNLDTQDDHRFYRINTSSLSGEGAEARYSKDLTLCQAKVNELQISEVKYESLCDESITTIKKREKQLIDGITKHCDPNKFDISLTVSFPGIKYLISEGIGLKLKSDIIFLDFVAVVNIVLPWIDFKAAMIYQVSTT
jgi:hypothetical protein